MAVIPEPTKASLTLALVQHAHQRWPQIHQIRTRFRGPLAYIDAQLDNGDTIKLCRLRYAGYATRWGFAIWRASHNDYQDSWLPNGSPSGTCEQALDTACGLYLGDPTAWLNQPERNLRT